MLFRCHAECDICLAMALCEFLPRFMVKHLTDLLTTPTTQDVAADPKRSYEESAFEKLKEKLPLAVFSCLQLSSKLHSRVNSMTPLINNFQRSVFRNKMFSFNFLQGFTEN